MLITVLLLFFTGSAHGVAVTRFNEAVYDTQTVGSFVIDEINGVACPSCDVISGQLRLPSQCVGEEGSHFRSCTKDSSITGTVMGSLNTWDIDFFATAFILEDVGAAVAAGTLNTVEYTWSGGSAFHHPNIFIQYDGNDNSFCLKGEDGVTAGLGGIDLSQGGTQNAIVLRSTLGDQDLVYDVTIVDTAGNSERQIMRIPRTCIIGVSCSSFSTPSFHYRINVGEEPVTFIPFTDMSIFSDVDAIEIRIRDNPESATGAGLDAGIGSSMSITTGFVDGCRFVDRLSSPEFTISNCGGTPMIPQQHAEFGSCNIEYSSPFTTDKHTWMSLPYGNTFVFTEMTDQNSLVLPAGLTPNEKTTFIEPGLFGNVDRRGFLGYPLIRFMGVTVPPFPFSAFGGNLGQVQLDFASTTGTVGGLFRNVSITAYYEDTTAVVCTAPGNPPVGTPLDTNLMPLSAPIPFTLTSTVPVGGSATTYTYVFDYDAGSNVVRGVLVDFGTFTCTTVPLPINLARGRMVITEYTLEADGYCHRPAARPPCRLVSGSTFIDDDGNGTFNPSIDRYNENYNLVTIQPDTPAGSLMDYASTTQFNGTYYTECYDVGTTLQVYVQPPPGVDVTTGNNPQNYTVTDDCLNMIPAVGFQNLHGVVFRVYSDENNNGAYTPGEPGIPGIQFKLTKIDEPNLGEMSFGTSDAMGNVLIPMVLGGNHTLKIVDASTGPIFGATQTEGMDPTNVTLSLEAGTTTAITNFGYHYTPAECSTGFAIFFIDTFNDADTSMTTTNDTVRSINVTRNNGGGYPVLERDMLITATSPMYMSTFGRMFAFGINFMVYPNTTSTLFLQWDGDDGSLAREPVNGIGGIDFTNGGAATGISLRLGQATGDFEITLTVGDHLQRVETQTRLYRSTTSMAFFTFSFIDPTIYQNVTFMEVTIENINPDAAGSTVYLQYVASLCELCETIVDFFYLEDQWGQDPDPHTIATPFQTFDDNTQVLPYAHYIEFAQNTHALTVLETGARYIMTDNYYDTLRVDFDVGNTGVAEGKGLRKVVLSVRVADSGLSTGAICTGPTLTFFDVNGTLITYPQTINSLEQITLGGILGVYGADFTFDAGANIIKSMRVDYTGVMCAGVPSANLTFGVGRLELSTDGSCGGVLAPLMRQEREADLFPLWMSTPFIVMVLVLAGCACCGAAGVVPKRRRRRRERPQRERAQRRIFIFF